MVPVRSLTKCPDLPFTWFTVGVQRDSSVLVPGDVVNLSTSDSSIVPCDMFLLSGDAIINESMLTGESVPVSKVPAKDDDLFKWRESRVDNPKAFMYGGTHIIRIRGSLAAEGQGQPALGLVVRTGVGFGTSSFQLPMIRRFQYHEGCSDSLHALSQTYRLQVLS